MQLLLKNSTHWPLARSVRWMRPPAWIMEAGWFEAAGLRKSICSTLRVSKQTVWRAWCEGGEGCFSGTFTQQVACNFKYLHQPVTVQLTNRKSMLQRNASTSHVQMVILRLKPKKKKNTTKVVFIYHPSVRSKMTIIAKNCMEQCIICGMHNRFSKRYIELDTDHRSSLTHVTNLQLKWETPSAFITECNTESNPQERSTVYCYQRSYYWDCSGLKIP